MMNKDLIQFAFMLIATSGAGILVIRLVLGVVDFGMSYSFTVIMACILVQRLLTKRHIEQRE